MAVLFLTGPLEPIDAQKYLESRIEKRLCEISSMPDMERISASAKEEMQWIADQGLANLYLLLAAWSNFLRENQLAWWCEIPKAPIVGWLLGIRQAIEKSVNVIGPFDQDEGVTLVVSEMGEKMLLAFALRQPSQIETPDRYVPIRWNCFWPQAAEAGRNEGELGTLRHKTLCSVFHYEGLGQLEKMEHDTRVRRRDQALNREEIQESFLSRGLISDSERQEHFLLLYLLWQESNLPEMPKIEDKAAMDELMKFSGVRLYMEDLALACLTGRSEKYGGDSFLFFMEHSLHSKIRYRFPSGKIFPVMHFGGAGRKDFVSHGLSEEDFRWMDRIHHLFAPQYLRGICEIQLRLDFYRRHYPLDWRRIMDTEKPETVSEKLNTALEILASASVTLEDYHVRITTGQLENYDQLSFSLGDRKFEQLYPEHPMSERNRLVRIGAADRIRDIAATRLSPFPETVLDKVYDLLFDCCGAVRHSLATALYHAGDHSSVEPLERLAREETKSRMVHDAAEVAAMRCRQRGFGCKQVPLEGPAVALVSSDITLAIELNRIAKETGCRLIFPEPDTSDLFVFPATVRVVNRRALGMKGWDYYIGFQQDLLRPIGEAEQKELAAAGINCSELTGEDAVLILTDGFLAAEEEAWGQLPKEGVEVYRTEEWMSDWIAAKVRELVERDKTAGR